MPHSKPVAQECPLIIRTTMSDEIPHSDNRVLRARSLSVFVEYPDYSTHTVTTRIGHFCLVKALESPCRLSR